MRSKYKRRRRTRRSASAAGAIPASSIFDEQLDRENTIALVSEELEGTLNGFMIASIVTAPPVYDPGSLVCMVDDFTVASADLWPTVGKELLDEVRRLANARGAKLFVVVCGHLDEPKRAMLIECGHTIASEWYVSV